MLKVRLYRPFDVERFAEALPASVKAISVLDRTKEPGSAGEPLYLDCVNALHETGRGDVRVVGGRYGLSSKVHPGDDRRCIRRPRRARAQNHFTIGIHDDLSGTSLDFDPSLSVESEDVFRALFYGLGSDGTVGANKDSIKIIGDNTANYAQGYFVYDSKRLDHRVASAIRAASDPLELPHRRGEFVGCHQPFFLERFDVLGHIAPGGVFLLNTPFGPERVWEQLPESAQRQIIEKHARFFAIDAHQVARECQMGGRINTIMQTCFFSISGVLPHDQAIAAIKDSIRNAYSKKGEEIVQMNLAAVDHWPTCTKSRCPTALVAK